MQNRKAPLFLLTQGLLDKILCIFPCIINFGGNVKVFGHVLDIAQFPPHEITKMGKSNHRRSARVNSGIRKRDHDMSIFLTFSFIHSQSNWQPFNWDYNFVNNGYLKLIWIKHWAERKFVKSWSNQSAEDWLIIKVHVIHLISNLNAPKLKKQVVPRIPLKTWLALSFHINNSQVIFCPSNSTYLFNFCAMFCST
jgi:hypothetical protein